MFTKKNLIALFMGVCCLSVANAEESNFKFSGFAEFAYRSVSQDDTNTVQQSGFVLNDAALYGSYKMDKLSFFLDLPFYRNADPTTTNASDDNNFLFAQGKAQAFGTYAFDDVFSVSFGQMDTIYGYELSDSKDRFFSELGILLLNTLPITHTGVMAEYNRSGASAKFFAANPNNKGSYGTDQYANTAYGLFVGYSTDMLRGNVGYTTQQIENVDGESDAFTLIDVMFGISYSIVDLDFQYDIVSDPSKDMDSDGEKDDDGTGLLVHLMVKATDNTTVGAKYESTTETVNSAGNFADTGFAVGVTHNISKDLMARIEYGSIESEATDGADKTDASVISIGTTVLF